MRTHAAAFLRPALLWRSLRWQIAGLAAAAASIVALVIGLLVHQDSVSRVMDQAKALAAQGLNGADGIYLTTGHVEAGPTAVGDVLTTGIPSELLAQLRNHPSLDPTFYDTTSPGGPWMWQALTTDNGTLIAVRIPMADDVRGIQEQDVFLVKAGLGTLAVVFVVVALSTELINRRLRRVAGTALRIAGGDLDARIGAHGGDEIAGIGTAVDTMAAALQQRLLSEQRFTADVAHELRTPLAGLVTAAELLPEDEATDLVRDRVRVLRGLVEELLEISRLDAGAERAELRPAPLGELVEEAVSRTGQPVVLDVIDAATVTTDPRRAERIIANLVHNACSHGRPPVEVTVTATVVRVRDHGPGFPDALLAEGPQRFRTGAPERGRGHGLGLTIALGQAAVTGAELTFANAPEGGAVATARFPAA